MIGLSWSAVLLSPAEMGASLRIAPYPTVRASLQVPRKVHQKLFVRVKIVHIVLLISCNQPTNKERQMPSTRDVDHFIVPNDRCCTKKEEESLMEMSEKQEEHAAPEMCAEQRRRRHRKPLLPIVVALWWRHHTS